MAKNYRLVRQCAHDGCRETSFYTYATQREYREGVERYANTEWFCSRHAGKNLNATSEPRITEQCITCVPSEVPILDGKHFWDTGSGFAFGDTWNAYAEDFPVGTKIVVRTTVEVVLPSSDQ